MSSQKPLKTTSAFKTISVNKRWIASQREQRPLHEAIKHDIDSLSTNWDNDKVRQIVAGLKNMEEDEFPSNRKKVGELQQALLKAVEEYTTGTETDTGMQLRPRSLSRAASAAVPRPTRMIRAQSLMGAPSAPGPAGQGGAQQTKSAKQSKTAQQTKSVKKK